MEAHTLVVGNLVVAPSHPEWGVGFVEQTDAHDVHVCFSRRGVGARVCSADLLVQHRYAVDSTVYSRSEQAYGTIQRVRETDGRTTYVVRFAYGQKNIPEHDIAPDPPANDSLEMLRNGEIEEADPFILGVQAHQIQHAYDAPELVSLRHARIEVLPHQVSVAYRVLSQQPRRFLLADEVGLGKTIETGLIIKELRARDMAARVLIIVPGNLVPQWIEELRVKFNEHFTRLDAMTLPTYTALHGSEEVWHKFDSIVTSQHLLRAHAAYVDALGRQSWDLIIFDEAHHLRRSLDVGTDGYRRNTQGYRIAERLAPRSDALLLLTATPLQLHPFEFFSLVQLLVPTLFPTFETFEAQRERIPVLNEIVRQLQSWETLSPEAQAGVAVDAARMLQGLSGVPSSSGDRLLQHLRATVENRRSIQDHIKSLHPLAPIVLRNRKRRVFPAGPRRVVRTLQIQYSPAERTAYAAVTAYLRDTYNCALADQNRALSFVMVAFHRMLTSSSYALRQSLESVMNFQLGMA